MKAKITLHTRLDEGIYASAGGGVDRIVTEWKRGPLNLLKAIAALHKERQANKNKFGTVGCGGSWLELDGERMDNSLIEKIEFEVQLNNLIRADKDKGYPHRTPLSKVALAKKYL